MAADKLLNVEIVTPQKVSYSGKAVSVSVPGSKSPFQVLYNHAPIVSTLELGEIKIINEADEKLLFATSPGFTEIRRNKVSILVESADDASKIDIDAVNNELSQAREDMVNSENPIDAERAKKIVLQAENKIKVYNRFIGKA